ncbi:hypothetical protein QBC34DRAFT_410737 [Podospora aff. communis PSN243]|uniref:C2H2-type domain-containing protein n=1 Tax=Podospora aff. communis PSN243 TaxID=3040156 RepID=A0AAV9GDU7_9PEZI|nr:hypothetical protein QBC34DRAFT_410737 [Podospora aff. communis PSN243]
MDIQALDTNSRLAGSRKHPSREPPKVHQSLALRSRDRSTSSLPSSEPTTIETNLDSETTPRTQSTNPTSSTPSFQVHLPLNCHPPRDQTKNAESRPDAPSDSSHHGQRRHRGPSHYRRQEVVIVQDRNPEFRTTHPTPYMGAYPRQRERGSGLSSTPAGCDQLSPLNLLIQDSTSPRSILENKRRVEDWVEDAAGIIGRLLSPDHGGSLRSHHAASIGAAKSSPSSTSTNGSQLGKSDKKNTKKQPRGLDKIPEESEDEQEQGGGQQPGPDKGKRKATDSLFVCPYFKYNSMKYVGKEWRSCCGPGWAEIRRMKEHLYTHHRQPKHWCRRCGECFEDAKTLDGHAKQEKPCAPQSTPPMDGFDEQQESQLRSRKREFVCLSEAEKWRKTYTILFPHVPQENIPSPFYHYEEVHRPSSLSDYEDFASRKTDGDLRAMLEQRLETDVGITEPEAKRRAVDWFKSMNRKLLGDFRRSRRRASTSTSATRPTIYQSTRSTAPPASSSPRDSSRQPTPGLIADEGLLDIYSEIDAEDLLLGQFDGFHSLGELLPLEDFELGYFSHLPLTLEVEVPSTDSGYGTMTGSSTTNESGVCPPESGDES